MLIVESLVDKKRFPAYGNEKIISLGDIAMYTDADEVPLKDVLLSMKKKENQALWENYPDLFERAIALEHGSAETNTSVKGLGRNWSWESYYNEFMANKEFEEAQLTFDQLFPDSPGGCLCGAPCGCYDG